MVANKAAMSLLISNISPWINVHSEVPGLRLLKHNSLFLCNGNKIIDTHRVKSLNLSNSLTAEMDRCLKYLLIGFRFKYIDEVVLT